MCVVKSNYLPHNWHCFQCTNGNKRLNTDKKILFLLVYLYQNIRQMSPFTKLGTFKVRTSLWAVASKQWCL